RTWKPIQDALPKEGIKMKFTGGSKGVTLLFEGKLFSLPIPDIKTPQLGNMPPFHLGASLLELSNLELRLNKRFEISVELKYYLPARLNFIFGEKTPTEPRLKIFDTYDAARPDGKYLGLKFYGRIGKEIEVGARISDIPVSLLEKDPNDPDYWIINLGSRKEDIGEYGKFRFKKPEFSFNSKAGGFKASGAFTILRDPAIPLQFLKNLLLIGGLKALADALPNKLPIPLTSFPQFFNNQGNLDVEGLTGWLKKQYNINLPAVFIEGLRRIATITDRLPAAFTRSLNFRFPDTLSLDISITPTGSVDIKLSASPNVKLLFIVPSAIPALAALELRSFSFGTLYAGSLFSMRVDADYHLFDVVNLGASLLIKDPNWFKYTGNPKNYYTQVSLHELFVVIVYQTQVPIPIPVFYKKLGIGYYGIGDWALEASASFPEPEFDLLLLGELFKDMVSFFRDPKFRLNPDKDFERLVPHFSLGPVYLKIPEFLGNHKLGLPGGYNPPSLYKCVAWLLNGIKFFNPASLVLSVPLKDRAGKYAFSTEFLGMHMSALWLLTTPEEFIQLDGYRLLAINDKQAQQLMEILPNNNNPVKPTDSGLIAFIRGTWQIKTGDKLEAAMGMVALNSRRFGMGLYLFGQINGLFMMQLIATLQIDPPDNPFNFYGKGKTKFELLGLEIFSGESTVKVDARQFMNLNGQFHLEQIGVLVSISSSSNMGGA
ncbi:MAG: hypothetical protein JNM68_15820, partial [Dinghuibacter sp.]|nr:hypothetical protein [Dinghuibacter sp.]